MIIISSLAIAVIVFVWAIKLECDYRIKEETSFNEHDLYFIIGSERKINHLQWLISS